MCISFYYLCVSGPESEDAIQKVGADEFLKTIFKWLYKVGKKATQEPEDACKCYLRDQNDPHAI